jgi:hypothetical protein
MCLHEFFIFCSRMRAVVKETREDYLLDTDFECKRSCIETKQH